MPTAPASPSAWWPGFPDPVEEARFRAQQNAEIGRRITFYSPLAIVFALTSGFGQALLFPHDVWVASAVILAIFVIAPLALDWRMARSLAENDSRIYPAVMATAASVVFGVCLLVAFARWRGYPMPYEGVLLAMMGIFLLSGLRARDATLVALGCLLGLVLIEWCWPVSRMDSIVRSFFGLCIWLLGSVFCIVIERADRRDFRNREALEALALHDPLTGLLNRRGLADRFSLLHATARRDGLPVSVALIDIDFFKPYNDTCGHDAGDNALVAVAQTIADAARRPLDISARLGGEEFLVIWHDADEKIGPQLADKLRAAVRALDIEHPAAPPELRLTVSVGLLCMPNLLGPEDIDTLYRRADAALYAAKHGGRNRVVVADDGEYGA